jgi:hypothetical protein
MIRRAALALIFAVAAVGLGFLLISQPQLGNFTPPEPIISIVSNDVTLTADRRCERDPHHFTVDFTLRNSGDTDGFATVELVIGAVTEARSNIDIIERTKFFVGGQSTEVKSLSGSAISCLLTEEDIFVRLAGLEGSRPGISVIEVGEAGVNTADLTCFRITPGGVFDFAPDEQGATSEIAFTLINTSSEEADAVVEMVARGEILSSQRFVIDGNSREVVSMAAAEILCGITAEEVIVRIPVV